MTIAEKRASRIYEYTEKYAKKHNISFAEASKHTFVRSYAEYIGTRNENELDGKSDYITIKNDCSNDDNGSDDTDKFNHYLD